jgi:hypothetical protein
MNFNPESKSFHLHRSLLLLSRVGIDWFERSLMSLHTSIFTVWKKDPFSTTLNFDG